jgi:hypothetical protein
MRIDSVGLGTFGHLNGVSRYGGSAVDGPEGIPKASDV